MGQPVTGICLESDFRQKNFLRSKLFFFSLVDKKFDIFGFWTEIRGGRSSARPKDGGRGVKISWKSWFGFLKPFERPDRDKSHWKLLGSLLPQENLTRCSFTTFAGFLFFSTFQIFAPIPGFSGGKSGNRPGRRPFLKCRTLFYTCQVEFEISWYTGRSSTLFPIPEGYVWGT